MTPTLINICLAIAAIVLLVNLVAVLMIGLVQSRLGRVERQGQRLEARAGEAALKLQALDDANGEIVAHVDRLAADVIHRELYRDKSNRQKLAIDAVQSGESLQGLVEDFGLSTDEAELLLALHRDNRPADDVRPAA